MNSEPSGSGIAYSALAIAALALIAALGALVVPGPQGPIGTQGPVGPQGETGLPGPGALMSADSANASLAITGTGLCVNYPGVLVWLNTTRPGTIVLTATATVQVSRVGAGSGMPRLAMFVGTSWSDCRQDPYFAVASMPSGALGFVEVSIPLQEVLSVPSATNHTFYVNGEMLESGGNPATILRASLVGLFYPE